MILSEWAKRWGVHPAAIVELKHLIGLGAGPPIPPRGNTEVVNQQKVRMKACKRGARLWRNNVGVLYDEKGRPVRFGLANDSASMNKQVKSSDLIGITPHKITLEDVGKTVGIFTSIEAKRDTWKYTGTAREVAQYTWIKLVISLGGIAKFSKGDL